MVNVSKIIPIKLPQKKGFRIVYILPCIECGINNIKCEKKYLKKHSGKCTKCVHKGIPYKSTFNHLKDSIERTNKKRNRKIEFNLTFEQFLKFTEIKNCFYCNHDIKWVRHTGSGQHRYNLDRKNSNLGYFQENLVVCCKNCNYMKGNYYSSEEFLKIIKFLDIMRNGTVIKK